MDVSKDGIFLGQSICLQVVYFMKGKFHCRADFSKSRRRLEMPKQSLHATFILFELYSSIASTTLIPLLTRHRHSIKFTFSDTPQSNLSSNTPRRNLLADPSHTSHNPLQAHSHTHQPPTAFPPTHRNQSQSQSAHSSYGRPLDTHSQTPRQATPMKQGSAIQTPS